MRIEANYRAEKYRRRAEDLMIAADFLELAEALEMETIVMEDPDKLRERCGGQLSVDASTAWKYFDEHLYMSGKEREGGKRRSLVKKATGLVITNPQGIGTTRDVDERFPNYESIIRF